MRRPGRPVTVDTTSTQPLEIGEEELPPATRRARHARPVSHWRWAAPVTGIALLATVAVLAVYGASLLGSGEGPRRAVVSPSPSQEYTRPDAAPPAVVAPSPTGRTGADRSRPRRTMATPTPTRTSLSAAPSPSPRGMTRPPASSPRPSRPKPSPDPSGSATPDPSVTPTETGPVMLP